ncbi:MAG: PIG-L deacetylase family protein [Candidatus Heimdallarchaeota archaeon]
MAKKLFLQPHYGDIAWSCGGLVTKHKKESIVVSIFPPKRKFYRLKFMGIIYRKKKREEKQFEKLIGFKGIYLKFKSAFLRGRTLETLFDKNLNELEQQQGVDLRGYLSKLILQEGITEVYCPKAQRNMIDHLIVKQAVYGLTATDITIYFYEDFPNFLPEAKKTTKKSKTKTIKVDISDVIEEKIQAIILYESLVQPYFRSKEKLVELIRKTPFETFWLED